MFFKKKLFGFLIQPRQDTEYNWNKYNPVCKDGEWIIVKCNIKNKYKIGDGVTPYKDLPFVTFSNMVSNGCIYSKIKNIPIKISIQLD